MAGGIDAGLVPLDLTAALDFGSTATSSAGVNGAPISFADYIASPVVGSGNESAGGLSGGVPVWLWAAVIAGAWYFGKRK